MNEGDALSFGSQPRGLIDQADAGVATPVERGIEVVHGETDVMDSGASRGHELADWRRGILRFEELDQRLSGGEPFDPGTVRIVERDGVHLKHVSIEGQDRVQIAHRDADVRDARTTTGWLGHSPNLRSVQ